MHESVLGGNAGTQNYSVFEKVATPVGRSRELVLLTLLVALPSQLAASWLFVGLLHWHPLIAFPLSLIVGLAALFLIIVTLDFLLFRR
jgi:hypothetical protein